MSYNVDTWKTKELTGLRIPVASLFMSDHKDWHPSRENHDDGTVTFSVMDGSFVKGTIDGDWLVVSQIEARGEGSGTALGWIFEPALEQSVGRLIAVRVWERGDSIDRLTVIDGVLTSEPVEL